MQHNSVVRALVHASPQHCSVPLGSHTLSCDTTAKMPLTLVLQYPEQCPSSLVSLYTWKPKSSVKVSVADVAPRSADYSTCPSMKVPVAPFFTVSTSNPLWNKPPPRGPPLSHPYFSALSLQVSALFLTGVVPMVARNKTAKDYLQESASFKVILQKRLGLEIRNSLAILFFYSCFAIFTSAKWSLSEKRLYPGFNFPSVNPLTLKSPPCLCSELLTLTQN